MINELIFKKAVEGDRESFYKLIEPIKDNLYKVAFVYLKNEDDALDCIHETIIKAMEALPKLNEPQYFNSWVTRITINICKNYIKKNKKVILVDIKDYENNIPIEDKRFENTDDIQIALSKLNEKERELIVMRYLDDMPLKNISQLTTVPLGTIKSRLNRTLKKLRVYMEEI